MNLGVDLEMRHEFGRCDDLSKDRAQFREFLKQKSNQFGEGGNFILVK